MKIESAPSISRTMTPSSVEEVLTVWDTNVPVHDPSERVIPPTKLHVTQLVRAPTTKPETSHQATPTKVLVGQAPSLNQARHDSGGAQRSHNTTDQVKVVSQTR